jgi:predicted alpha-1,6-mannanase (GH76 family)
VVKVPAVVTNGINTLLTHYYVPSSGLFQGSSWQSAVAFSTLEAYWEAIKEPSLAGLLSQTYTANGGGNNESFENNYDDDTAWWGLTWLQGYNLTHNVRYLDIAERIAAYIHQDWNNTGKCGGGGIAWERSGPQFEYTGAIQNELFLELTAWLHNTIVENEKSLGAAALNNPYLNWATQEWKWFQNVQLFHAKALTVEEGTGKKKTNITIPAYLIPNSSPSKSIPSNAECGPGNIRYSIYTYNEGVILAGLGELSIATNNREYLTDAEKIADAVLEPPTTLQDLDAVIRALTGKCPHGAASCSATDADILTYFGVLTEPTSPIFQPPFTPPCCTGDGASFKGIFVRDLKMLAQIANTTQYNCFFITQANSITERDTTTETRPSQVAGGKAVTLTLFGFYWSGPPEPVASENQVSALESLIAAINVPGNSCPTTHPTLPPPPPNVPSPPSPPAPPPPSRHVPSPPSRVERCYDTWYRTRDCRQEHGFGPHLARAGRGHPFR